MMTQNAMMTMGPKAASVGAKTTLTAVAKAQFIKEAGMGLGMGLGLGAWLALGASVAGWWAWRQWMRNSRPPA